MASMSCNRLSQTCLCVLLLLWLGPSDSQNWCCKNLQWDSEWCHRGDCLGRGCMLDDPTTSFDEGTNICSDISDCECLPLVQYKSKAFCTVLTSCAKAKEDLEMGRRMHQLYKGTPADDVCVEAIKRVVCSYHFPLCESDRLDYPQICYDTCLSMYNACSNLTLPFFASVGSRCNFETIHNPDRTLIDERDVREGNRDCTSAMINAFAGCFASSSRVRAMGPGGNISSVSVGDLRAGDRVLSYNSLGSPEFSKIVFAHQHTRRVATVRIHLDNSTEYLETTPNHLIPILEASAPVVRHAASCKSNSVGIAVPASSSLESGRTPTWIVGHQSALHPGDPGSLLGFLSLPRNNRDCGRKLEIELLPAGEVKEGDRVYTVGPNHRMHGKVVTRVSKSDFWAKYIIAGQDFVMVDGAVLSALSTFSGSLETLPFRFLDWMLPGVLQWGPVAASLAAVMESPALIEIEYYVNQVFR